MDKNKVENQQIFKYLVFASIIGLTFAFYGGYLFQTYQTDTYNNYFNIFNDYKYITLNTGRYIQYLYFWICDLFNNSPPQNQLLHVGIALIINAAIAILMYFNLYIKISENKFFSLKLNIVLLISVLCFRYNVFFADILQYGDAAVISFLGDLFAIISAIYISKKGKKTINYILSLLFLFLSISSTQTAIFWFVMYSMILYFIDYLEEPHNYQWILELFKRISVYAVVCIIELFIFKFLVSSYIDGRGTLLSISDSMVNILLTIKSLLLNCMAILPDYFYVCCAFACFLLLLLVLIFYTKNQKVSEAIKCFIISILVIIGTFLAIFVVGFMDTWLAHRTVVGYATFVPLMLVMVVAVISRKKQKLFDSKIWSYMGIVFFTVFIGVNWYSSMNIYRGEVITNALDRRDVEFYYSEILEYENSTGISIDNIAVIRDFSYTWTFPDVVAAKNINSRAFSNGWAIIPIFKMFTGRDFKLCVLSDLEQKNIVKDRNWNNLSEDQVEFNGNTAYIILY